MSDESSAYYIPKLAEKDRVNSPWREDRPDHSSDGGRLMDGDCRLSLLIAFYLAGVAVGAFSVALIHKGCAVHHTTPAAAPVALMRAA